MAVKKYYVTVGVDGTIWWHKDAKCTILHRTGAPAIEWASGAKSWYQNGLLHSTDGPAIELADGTKLWYQNGDLHRTDGPAIEYTDGRKAWGINGKVLTEDEFLASTQPVIEMTVADVEKLVGKRVKIIK